MGIPKVREALELRARVLDEFPTLSVNLSRRHAPEVDGFTKTAKVGQFELELNTPTQFAASRGIYMTPLST